MELEGPRARSRINYRGKARAKGYSSLRGRARDRARARGGARSSRHHAASEAALGPIDLQLVEGQIQ